MFLLVLKLYQMDVAHAILFARKLDVSRLTVRYLSAKFELFIQHQLKKEYDKQNELIAEIAKKSALTR